MKATTFIAIYFTVVAILLLLFISVTVSAQDSVKVKITKIVRTDSTTYVWMKSKKAIYYSACTCKVPYKEKDIIWILKPKY